ncbi:uncharacterized protein LOC121637864 isoform X1 [Melanotaenia boesemani]|uniref:uncharacterized protein LOC121637864 isoform X1 n=1 Tax=Melanotaenia boesemani TaxID=1250792 RepID=UPI001C05603A|nr:uncharacterized protein LOC121637864 isoform X1 [Melanotaenia boesemani]
MMNHFTFDLIYNTVLTNSGAEPSEPTEIEKQQLNLNFAKMRTFSIFYSLLCATLTEAAEINVEGHEWGEISFQCTHRHAFNNDKYFCKSPCKSNEDILVAVSPGTSVESGRITLQDSGNGAFTVTIKHLQLSDSQIYFCGVDRWGRDTYTSVHLSVHKALSTTIEPVISSTLTYQKITNSTQLTAGAETSEPTNLSTAKNFTNEEEQNISLGTMLYAAVGAVATLAILLLAIHLRKMPKCQPHVCSTSKDPSSMNKNNQEKDTQDPQAPSAGTAEDMPIYENISFSEGTAGSRYPPADQQNNHDLPTRIYINPLPSALPERKISRPPKDTTNVKTPKRQEITESSASNASLCLFTSSSEPTGPKPTSLWFGLDLSKTNQK